MSHELTQRILIVDDEVQIRRLLRAVLGATGYRTVEAASASEAYDRIALDRPDLVLLDLGLPDADGTDVVRRVREWSTVPIIVVSVRDAEDDKVAALDLGADDYVTKPFHSGELLARIRAALRHALAVSGDDPVCTIGDLTVDLGRRIITVHGSPVKLTPKEYDVLRVLVRNVGRVVTHRQLLREVWGPTFVDQTHYLRVHVGTLRAKLEPDPTRPRLIVTESGVGYRLVEGREGG